MARVYTGTSCRAASPDRSEWGEERGAGRVRLDWVQGGDSRQTGPPGRPGHRDRATGPSRTTIQDVPLEVGHHQCQQTTVTAGTLLALVTISANKWRVRIVAE